MATRPLLLHFADDLRLASAIAQVTGFDIAPIQNHRFPDGEIKLQLPAALPARCIVLRSLHNPNEKLVELLLVARAARDFGSCHLTLVAPYLAYMRQDMAFQSGEVISQRVIGRFLADLFDSVITVDPHLHRVGKLSEAVPATQAVSLSGAPLLADLIAQHHTNPLLIGPDEESAQWLAQAAAAHGFEHAVCKKVRHGDREVDIALPGVSIAGRAVVLLDDVASSGHTLAAATTQILAAGASCVDVAVTHALFAGDALQVIQRAGARHIWSTDCIAHPTNAVSMAAVLASTLISQNI